MRSLKVKRGMLLSCSCLWRNRLARSAVNRKVGGSSPPRDARSLLVCLFIYLFICLFIYLFVYSLNYLFIYVCVCMYLFTYLLTYLFVCLFIYFYFYIFMYLIKGTPVAKVTFRKLT